MSDGIFQFQLFHPLPNLAIFIAVSQSDKLILNSARAINNR